MREIAILFMRATTIIGGVAASWQLLSAIGETSSPKQGASAAIAVGLVVIPYCIWRAIEGHESSATADFEPLSPTLSIGLHSNAKLVRPSFQGLPLVQLEISAELPWVIDADEPN